MRYPHLLLLLLPAAVANPVARPNLPLYFEPAPTGAFVLRTSAGDIALAAYGLQSGDTQLQLLGTNPKARLTGADPQPGVSNYLLGPNPAQWRTQVPHFSRLHAKAIYPGIDLVYYIKNQQLEFDFLLAPGADPNQIRLTCRGPATLQPPTVYQGPTVIGSRFLRHGDELTLQLDPYDQTRPLTIDPVLSFSTLLTAANAAGAGIAIDPAGNTYLTGNATSGFLTINPLQPTKPAGRAAFVAKFNPTGSALVYATYLNGTAADSVSAGYRIALDPTGAAYLIGSTNSTTFPTTAGTIQPINKGGEDLFIAKLDPSGSRLIYSTYFGGSADDGPATGFPAIAVDPAGNAYIAGGTASRNFPTTPGALQTTYGGGLADAFVAKFDPLGSQLLYSTYLGGPGNDSATGLAIDPAGNAYLTGSTDSPSFPKTANAFQSAYGGGDFDAFAAKLNPTGTALAYSTFLGGANGDGAYSLAVDPAGNAYIGGVTTSTNFPVSSQAFQKANAGGGDAFVTKLNPAGTALVYSTYLGGTQDDFAFALAVDSQGSAVLTGGVQSPDFPVTADAFQRGLGLLRRGAGRTAATAFLTKLNPAGSALAYSTYFGGSRSDAGTGVALDSAGNALLTGVATSLSFPRTAFTFEPPDREDFSTAFLAKFDLSPRSSIALGSVVSAASYQGGTTGTVAPGQIVVLFGNDIGPASLTTLKLTPDGRVDTLLAGVRVTFDGIPAPLLYVSARQLSAVVPYGVPPNGRTTVQVDFNGQRSNPLVLWVSPALVGIFTQNSSGRGPGAVLNQDGTLNTPANPAEKGSVITLFATGEGQTVPPGVDGRVAADPLPRPALRIFASVDFRTAEVLYVGAAPGLVAGVLQMNVKIPDNARSGPDIPLNIGGTVGPFGVEPSETVTIAIR